MNLKKIFLIFICINTFAIFAQNEPDGKMSIDVHRLSGDLGKIGSLIISISCIPKGAMAKMNPNFIGSYVDNKSRTCFVYPKKADGKITYKNRELKVYLEYNSTEGYLSNDEPIKVTCIKKGSIGMPNISMPSYRGMYTAKNGDKCYVFKKQD